VPTFSDHSLSRLYTCHANIIIIFKEVIKHYNCRVVWGWRNEEAQNDMFHAGLSKKMWPNSPHNTVTPDGEPCACAIDVAPWIQHVGIDWEDHQRFINFDGFVKGVAADMRFEVRSGSDWDRDWDLKDQTFIDRAHFEILLGA